VHTIKALVKINGFTRSVPRALVVGGTTPWGLSRTRKCQRKWRVRLVLPRIKVVYWEEEEATEAVTRERDAECRSPRTRIGRILVYPSMCTPAG